MSRAAAASVLEYDATIPARYLVGTDSGAVLACSRKAKTQSEVVVGRFPGHCGPVRALQRNPAFSKVVVGTLDNSINKPFNSNSLKK